MRIIFMGTPQFAVASLEILVKNKYEVVAVITSPDKPAGRGQQLQQSAVKEFAVQHNLKVLQPSNLKDENFLTELKELNADLQLVVAFRMLPESVWNMPPLGTYNLHASLLPQYRGAAPINWAIINGEKETGATTFKLKHEIDTGNILMQHKVAISETMNAGGLHDVLMKEGAELVLQSVRKIESGNYELKPQDNNVVSKHAPKLFKEDGRIDWNKNVKDIYNLIRGLSPYPCAWAELQEAGKTTSFKLFTVSFTEEDHSYNNGHILTDHKAFIKVACGAGYIHIEKLQMAGKKAMQANEFLRGFSFKEGAFFV